MSMQDPITLIEPRIANRLSKQKYHLVGEHGGVKVCHWTKQSLVNDRSCYKGTFYGIESHGCMQMAPNVDTCNLACTYCWREPHSETLNRIDDDPYELFLQSVKAHRRLITGYGGNPKADPKKFAEAQNPKHVAISLNGEPTLYSRLGEFLDIHDLFDKPEIKIKDDKVILKDKRFTSHYPTAEKSIVVAPTKSIELDNYDYQFTIRKKDIEDYLLIRKRTRKRLPDFLIQNNKGNFNFKLTDIKNRNSANVDFNVDEDNKTNRQFMFHLKCENFDKILIDDYDAEVSPDKLLMLYNRNKFLKYWIALEPSSEFDSNESEVKNNA